MESLSLLTETENVSFATKNSKFFNFFNFFEFLTDFNFLDCYYDCVYAGNSYYIFEKDTGIWKKEINSLDPIPFYPIRFRRGWTGRILRTGLHGRVLVACEEKRRIVIIDLKERQPQRDDEQENNTVAATNQINKEKTKETLQSEIDREVDRNVIFIGGEWNGSIMDHQVVGEKQDHLLVLTMKGQLVLYKFDINEQTSKVVKQGNLLLRKRDEVAGTIAVCPKNKYFMVSTYMLRDHVASRLMVVTFDEDTLIEKCFVEVQNLVLDYLQGNSFYGYFGERDLIYACITAANASTALMTFHYDVEDNVLEEIGQVRKIFGFCSARILKKREEELYSIDKNGKVMKLSYVLESCVNQEDAIPLV